MSQRSEKIFWKIWILENNLGKCLENWKILEILESVWTIVGKQLEHFGESGFFLPKKLGSFWKTILGSTTFQTLENHVGVIFKTWNQHLEHGQAKAMATWALPMEPCRKTFQMGPWFQGVPYTLCVNIQKTMEKHHINPFFMGKLTISMAIFNVANC